MSHSYSRSGGASSNMFPLMFLDNMVAQKFQMQRGKLSYVVTYVLCSFIQCSFASQVKLCDFFVVSFYENLNKASQKSQIYLVVMFWHSESNTVSTRYLTSVFVILLSSIIQICIDGSNVNLKFLPDTQEILKVESDGQEFFFSAMLCFHKCNSVFKGIKSV
ncbi:hypothetical protein PR048_012958 [Dryococelus australis]|uniref:Uncharacterized protein n=1 Tax=Dryococelus australis TaxID=614101 RepID=A0ABQ9HRN9_9NEOP|nr:hypothetical protein PR048_012958 [Dryococelus australis]